MKLKKIASLALAGVMAASMLAGCNTGSSDSNSTPNQGGTETVPTSAVVNLFNSKQTYTNTVKVEFTGDAEMEKNLQAAVEMAGIAAPSAANVLKNYQAITGTVGATGVKAISYSSLTDLSGKMGASYFKTIPSGTANNWMRYIGFYDKTFNAPAAVNGTSAVADGKANTYMMLVAVEGSSSIQSPETAANQVMTSVNKLLAQLDAEDKTGNTGTPEEKYYAYSYTGTAGAVVGTSNAGTPVYYVVMTLTQTVSVKANASV